MREQIRFGALVIATSVLFAGCGGTQTTGAAPAIPLPTATAASSPGSFSGPSGTARVTVSFSTTPAAHQRSAKSYLPPKTKSISLYVTAVNGAAAGLIYTTVPVGSGAAGCTTSGGALTCSISIAAPVGSDTFSGRAYAQAGGQGQPLSIGTATATVATNQTTDVALDFLPVVSFVNVALSQTSVPQNAPATVTATFTAEDVDLDPITGTDPYYSPIVVTTGDTSGHVTAVPALPATLTAPGQNIVFTYDGKATAASFIFNFAVTGDLVSGLVRSTPVAISFTSTTQHLYVVQQSQNAVYAYDINADGSLSATPSRTISGAATQLASPTYVFVDKLGAIYVLNQLSDVTVYPAGANGNVAPTNTVGQGTHPIFLGGNGDEAYTIIGLNNVNDFTSTQVYFGSIYSGEVPTGATTTGLGSFAFSGLRAFATAPGGAGVPPTSACGAYIANDDTGSGNLFCFPNPIPVTGGQVTTAISQDAGGPVYVQYRPDGLIATSNEATYDTDRNVSTWAAPVITAGSTPSSTPVYQIAGSNTGLRSPQAIAYDALGNMYVADTGLGSGQGVIFQWPMNANGNVAPTRSLGGFTYLYGIAVGP